MDRDVTRQRISIGDINSPEHPSNRMTLAWREIAKILKATRAFILRPGTDFTWSTWDDAPEALREIDGIIDAVERGQPPRHMTVWALFLPTGPLHEVSIAGDWTREFGIMADRAEQLFGVIDAAGQRPIPPPLA